MSFARYIKAHYTDACALQREIPKDIKMIAMLRNGPASRSLVKSWMRDYGLFQGITNRNRDAIVKRFLHFAFSPNRPSKVTVAATGELYTRLFTALFKEVPRSWMSATSKLLWCLYPESIVMYDKFVHRALVVMQCLDSDILTLQRIGTPPMVRNEADIALATEHYLTYEAAVRKLLSVHRESLQILRRRNNETYPYDIRIIDKLLWMIGNPSADYYFTGEKS